METPPSGDQTARRLWCIKDDLSSMFQTLLPSDAVFWLSRLRAVKRDATGERQPSHLPRWVHGTLGTEMFLYVFPFLNPIYFKKTRRSPYPSPKRMDLVLAIILPHFPRIQPQGLTFPLNSLSQKNSRLFRIRLNTECCTDHILQSIGEQTDQADSAPLVYWYPLHLSSNPFNLG